MPRISQLDPYSQEIMMPSTTPVLEEEKRLQWICISFMGLECSWLGRTYRNYSSSPPNLPESTDSDSELRDSELDFVYFERQPSRLAQCRSRVAPVDAVTRMHGHRLAIMAWKSADSRSRSRSRSRDISNDFIRLRIRLRGSDSDSDSVYLA